MEGNWCNCKKNDVIKGFSILVYSFFIFCFILLCFGFMVYDKILVFVGEVVFGSKKIWEKVDLGVWYVFVFEFLRYVLLNCEFLRFFMLNLNFIWFWFFRICFGEF